MARLTIRVGERADGSDSSPVWLHSLADYGNVKRTIRYPLGDWSLSWEMDLFRGANPSALKQGRVVEAWLGGMRVWGGTMDAVDLDSGSYSASGFCRQAEDARALDGNGQATADLGLAIFAASNFGRKVFNVGALENWSSWTQQMEPPTEPQMIGALLDHLCDLNGRRWLVDSNRLLQTTTDPTTPTLFISSDERPGISTDTQATDVIVGYLNSSYTYVTEQVGTVGADYRIEKLVDATGLGPITQAAARNVGVQTLAKSGPNATFTSSITVSAGQVANGGGARVHPVAMVPGKVYRINGMPDPRNGALAADVLMGEAVWDEEDATVQLTPYGAERDDLQATVEALGGVLV